MIILRMADPEKIEKYIFHLYTVFSQFTKQTKQQKSNLESWLKVTLRFN